MPAITTADLRKSIAAFGIPQVDLLRLDCEGAEYVILPELERLGVLSQVGWIRGEWHSKSSNGLLKAALASTHASHIDPNDPHEVGMFLAHRKLD